MGSRGGGGGGEDGVTEEIDSLEKGLLLLSDSDSYSRRMRRRREDEEDEEAVLYAASFQEMEDNYVKYQTVQWVLYSLLLLLAWGIGLLMLLYIPVRRYVLRKEVQSKMLFITPNAIVYKVTRPVPFPCFGVLKKEKHILLPSIADIVVEQGYLQSYFGVYSIRIENVGVRRPSSDDVQIQGIANPRDFRKAVLTRLANMKSENFSRQVSRNEHPPNFGMGYSPAAWIRQDTGAAALASAMSPSKSIRHDQLSSSGELILQKLEEVGSSMKRVQSLIEEQKRTHSQPIE